MRLLEAVRAQVGEQTLEWQQPELLINHLLSGKTFPYKCISQSSCPASVMRAQRKTVLQSAFPDLLTSRPHYTYLPANQAFCGSTVARKGASTPSFHLKECKAQLRPGDSIPGRVFRDLRP
jgi:hypothetical protein